MKKTIRVTFEITSDNLHNEDDVDYVIDSLYLSSGLEGLCLYDMGTCDRIARVKLIDVEKLNY